jgi:hypothetical protein
MSGMKTSGMDPPPMIAMISTSARPAPCAASSDRNRAAISMAMPVKATLVARRATASAAGSTGRTPKAAHASVTSMACMTSAAARHAIALPSRMA